MTAIDRKALAATLAILVVAACALWLPFVGDVVIYQTPDKGSSPAGAITASVSLRETARLPKRNRMLPAGAQPCFGVRFATYARANEGRLVVEWAQDRGAQSWPVQVRDLEDNAYRYFCPGDAFDIDRPFHIQVRGIDSPAAKAATLWLVDRAPMGRVEAGDDAWRGKGMALAIAARKRVGPRDIVALGQGAFLLCWSCSLAIGVAALAFAFRRPV